MVKRTFEKLYLFIIFAILYLPIIVLIFLSFNNSRSSVIWGGFTLEWYRTMFESPMITSAFGTTVLLAVLSSFLSVVIGVPAAIGIYFCRNRMKTFFVSLTNIPILNADIVTGIALMLIFVKFMNLGFSTVLLGHITFNVPYIVLNVLPRLNHVESTHFEAAQDLGCSQWQAFWKVIFPDLLPGILTGFLMAITMSLDDFMITYFTKGPNNNTLSTMIYGQIRKGIKPEMYALSTLLFLIVLILLFIMNLLSSRKEKEESITTIKQSN